MPQCAVVVRFAVPPVSSPGPSSFSDSVAAVAIIPARYQSTRLPGKALADIGGRPMIELGYRRAAAARSISSVIVATPDQRIFPALQRFGGTTRMTAASNASGTNRFAEVAAVLYCYIVVNVQGDDPLIKPQMIYEVVAPFATY